MARISGVDLPKQKQGWIGLTYVYGIGVHTANEILKKAEIDPSIKIMNWTDEQIAAVRHVIGEDYTVEGALRSEVQMNIKRLMDIGSRRGIRHRKGLPVRGQRTKTNNRTRRGGKKRTVAGKKAAPRK